MNLGNLPRLEELLKQRNQLLNDLKVIENADHVSFSWLPEYEHETKYVRLPGKWLHDFEPLEKAMLEFKRAFRKDYQEQINNIDKEIQKLK